MMLPVGVAVPEEQQAGHDPGAPSDPQIKRKIILTSLLTFCIGSVVLYIVLYSNLEIRQLLGVGEWHDVIQQMDTKTDTGPPD